jgi:hypothetical protein
MKNHTQSFTTENRRTLNAERLEMVERFRRSGQTRRAFCDSEGVAKSTLDWWLRRSKGWSRKKRMAFQEVSVVSGMGSVSNWAQEVVSPQGWTIRSRQTLSIDEIVRLLREAGC